MKKQVISTLLVGAMAVGMLAGCGDSTSTGAAATSAAAAASSAAPAAATSAAAAATSAAAAATSAAAAAAGTGTVGVAMPTKDLQRWNQDGSNMKDQLEAAGYTVDLQYANNDVSTQVSQIENMVANGDQILVIASIDGSSLGTVLAEAKAKNIPVIAYDRLIMQTDAVSYYATFDNYKVGTIQGQYIEDQLGLKDGKGPFNIEIFTGDPADNNAQFFYNGAMDVLKPYITSGKLVVKSGQTEFADVATANWSTETAQSRMENIISSYYSDGTTLDAVLCSNDSTALGVENALSGAYNGTWPVITGQDCDMANVKNMIAGKQSMSVFKDTRELAKQVVKMVGQVLTGATVDVNNTKDYDNGTGVIPTYLCDPVFADKDNYKTLLIDSGYYTEADLQ
ncbi:MAG: sugar-binding protein [Lachnospiraceae bacterium]|jgi:putative multiple sugar transport system substrate-binding protein|nr:sugar-binding protein [Lachnospiraceae bacterium]